MRPLEQEQNPEVLRQYALLLEGTVKELTRKLNRIENLRAGADEGWLNVQLRDQLTRLQKKYFGFGREKVKTRKAGHRQQELRLHGKRVSDEATKSKKSCDIAASDAPLVKVHEFSQKELEAESTRREIREIGERAWRKMKDFYQESTEITVVERTYQKVIHRQAKYRLKDEYNTTGKEVIITAPGPAKLKAGFKYSIDFALSVVSDKYEYHLPLERQRRKMQAAGLEIDVKTLYRLCESVAEHCESVLDPIRQEIMDDYCAVHLDETPWRILGSKSSGYLWVMGNRVGSYYRFEPTRSGKVPTEMLKGYRGSVVTDAYGGYNPIRKNKGIRVGHCWSHARREFYERYDDYPQEAGYAIELIDMLFDCEDKAKTFEELRAIRKNESRVVCEEFYKWCLATLTQFLPGDGISKAIQYCLNHKDELTLFLRDLSVPMSNNDAERALRHAVVGRKNYNGSQTINGADVAATLFTIIETCKKLSVQPTEYLRYLVTERWHGREPLTPKRWAFDIAGVKPDTSTIWPAKDDWKIWQDPGRRPAYERMIRSLCGSLDRSW